MKKRNTYFIAIALCATLLSTNAFANTVDPENIRTIRILKVGQADMGKVTSVADDDEVDHDEDHEDEELKGQKSKLKEQQKALKKEAKEQKKAIKQTAKEQMKALKEKVKEQKKAIRAMINGKEAKFDVPPVVKDGRTLIPIRGVSQSFGAKIDWNAETKTVTITKDGKEIILTLGSNVALVNGEEVTIDVALGAMEGRTVVPLRFIGEIFGANVQWNSTDQTVVIDTEEEAVEEPAQENTTDQTQDTNATQETSDSTQENTDPTQENTDPTTVTTQQA